MQFRVTITAGENTRIYSGIEKRQLKTWVESWLKDNAATVLYIEPMNSAAEKENAS